MPLSNSASLVWGKTDDMSKRQGRWLPLIAHLLDAGYVAGKLFDALPHLSLEPLRHGTRSDREARDRFVALCALHDIGKATPGFLNALPTWETATARNAKIKESGIDIPVVDRTALHHWEAAMPILERKYGEEARSFTSIVASHHGYAPDIDGRNALSLALEDIEDGIFTNSFLGWSDGWWEVQVEIIDHVLKTLGVDPRTILMPVPHYDQPVVIGLVMLVDWIASDSRFFYTSEGYTEWSFSRASAGWKSFGFPKLWCPDQIDLDTIGLYEGRFPESFPKYTPYPMQVETVEAARGLDSPSLIIVESGMGSGKTEAALAAAEVMNRNLGGAGVAFAMPTMATTDAVFNRVKSWAENVADAGSPIPLHLGHGRSQFSKVMQSLLSSSAHTSTSDEDGGVVASATLNDKMGAIASASASTIDQIATMALGGYPAYTLHGALAGKTVIFDEVHTYDAYTMVYLTRSIEYLAAHGNPVIILSATLSAERRDEITLAYTRGARSSWLADENLPEPELQSPTSYPLITVVDPRTHPDYIDTGGESGEPEKEVEVVLHYDDTDDLLVRLISENTPSGGCVGVIRSTVARAQQAYETISASFPEDRVILIHSRFTAGDRLEKLDELEATLGRGKPRNEEGKRVIVVATQVIEQSMDVDFDYMVSDLCPLDMLLQRIGRLHRHQQSKTRPVSGARFDVVSAEIDEKSFRYRTSIESKIGFIYSHYQLHLAAETISSLPVLRTPQDIPGLIAKMNAPVGEAPASVLRMHRQWQDQEKAKRERAQRYVLEGIPLPSEDHHSPYLDDACNVKGREYRKSIRDADGSIEGLLLNVSKSGLSLPSGKSIPDGDIGTEISLEVGASTIRLPIIPGYNGADLESPEQWAKNPILRGRKIIPMRGGIVDVGGRCFTYSRDGGLLAVSADHDD